MRSGTPLHGAVARALTTATFGLGALVMLLGGCRASDSPARPTSPTVPGAPPSTPPSAQSDWRIAFVTTRDGSPQIYLATEDGGLVHRLTSGEYPAWSWDGRRIVFHRAGQIRVIDADGTSERVVGAGFMPSWSPDGSRIVYSTGVGLSGGGIYMVNADGSNPQRVVRDDFATSRTAITCTARRTLPMADTWHSFVRTTRSRGRCTWSTPMARDLVA